MVKKTTTCIIIDLVKGVSFISNENHSVVDSFFMIVRPHVFILYIIVKGAPGKIRLTHPPCSFPPMFIKLRPQDVQ